MKSRGLFGGVGSQKTRGGTTFRMKSEPFHFNRETKQASAYEGARPIPTQAGSCCGLWRAGGRMEEGAEGGLSYKADDG